MSKHVSSLFDLSGKTALVTGGSRGLGLQIAECLGEAGARVMLTARKEKELSAAVEHLSGRGIEALWVAADASEPEHIQQICDQTIAAFGHVDILVNNAGATWAAPAEDHPLAAWDKIMNLNVRSVFLMSQAIANACMIERGQGRIINLASIAGLAGSTEAKFIAYGTSKGAVVNFTRTLAAEWGRYGINVNAIAPGFFPSKMTRGLISELGEGNMASKVPLQRLGDDDDLKGAALLFASEAGKHITGQILAVDGGASAVVPV
ncbi:MAG: SDR family oxidoreductase [Granulosicoccus sp.]